MISGHFDKVKFAKEIHRFMRRTFSSKRLLAKWATVSPATIVRISRGDTGDLDTILKLCVLMNVNVMDFWVEETAEIQEGLF